MIKYAKGLRVLIKTENNKELTTIPDKPKWIEKFKKGIMREHGLTEKEYEEMFEFVPFEIPYDTDWFDEKGENNVCQK